MKSGSCGNALILSMIAWSVPTTLELAGLLKPMWLSLIWTKWSSPFAVFIFWPKARELRTPLPTVQITPAPAQAMHCQKSTVNAVVIVVVNE